MQKGSGQVKPGLKEPVAPQSLRRLVRAFPRLCRSLLELLGPGSAGIAPSQSLNGLFSMSFSFTSKSVREGCLPGRARPVEHGCVLCGLGHCQRTLAWEVRPCLERQARKELLLAGCLALISLH